MYGARGADVGGLSSETRASCEIELLSTSRQTKPLSYLAANRGKDQHRDSNNTAMSEPDKFTNCWKENKSRGLNHTCSGADERSGEPPLPTPPSPQEHPTTMEALRRPGPYTKLPRAHSW
ncbi:unnamed protein product [Pleuronectes platessa]|uniref:Uncharacterized protein n=1 Tax=Pleuronectes platessa TaxID=8262 RepID=A0A9N7W1Y4_PLEPL|nr:unnamed protein product [Pleuronectes platessa]